MDVLSEVLRAFELADARFFEVEAGAPWAGVSADGTAVLGVPLANARHVILLHSLIEGSCWAQLADRSAPAVQVDAGDTVVFPAGDAYTLGSSPEVIADIVVAIRSQAARRLPILLRQTHGSGERCRFIGGHLDGRMPLFQPLLDVLPRLLHLRGGGRDCDRVTEWIHLAVDECRGERAGRESILVRTSELIFVELVRLHLETLPPASRGWLSGIRDPHIGEALRIVHSRPAEPWTIEALAREVGLSRSAFAERFHHFVDIAPMHYLVDWRIRLAARLLARPGVSIAEAGAEVGYKSEAAFSRAFRKCMGVPPGAWRRMGR